MNRLQTLSQKELLTIDGGIIDGPISDWVACKVESFIDSMNEYMSQNDFDHGKIGSR